MVKPGPPISVKDYILPMICAVIVCISYVCWYLACKYEKSMVRVTVILNLQIIFTYVADIFFVSRTFVLGNFLGALVVTIACLGIVSGKDSKDEEHKDVVKGESEKAKSFDSEELGIQLKPITSQCEASVEDEYLEMDSGSLKGKPRPLLSLRKQKKKRVGKLEGGNDKEMFMEN